MALSCHLVSTQSSQEEMLTSFQLECSQILQNVCSEATSTFSILSLMGAGWIGQFAKLSCLNFVSRFSSSQVFRQSSSFIYSAGVEGLFFHGCSTLKQGMVSPFDFAKGSAHSGIILAGCKLSGGIAPHSFVMTQLFQCFAIVQINEVCGGILTEREIGTFEQKMVRAFATSLPILFSGQILASCSLAHRIRQAKHSLKIEIHKSESTQIKNLIPFSPFGESLVTVNGLSIRNIGLVEAQRNEAEKMSRIYQMVRKGEDRVSKVERIQKNREREKELIITIQDLQKGAEERARAKLELIEICGRNRILKLAAKVGTPDEVRGTIQAAVLEVIDTISLQELETTSLFSLISRQLKRNISPLSRARMREGTEYLDALNSSPFLNLTEENDSTFSTYQLANKFRAYLRGDNLERFNQFLSRLKEEHEETARKEKQIYRKGRRGDEEAYLAFRFQVYRRTIEFREEKGLTPPDSPVVDWFSPSKIYEVPSRLDFEKIFQDAFEAAARRRAKVLCIDFLGNASERFPEIISFLRESSSIEQVRIFCPTGGVHWFFKGLEGDPKTIFQGYAPVTGSRDLRTLFEYRSEEVHAVCLMTPFIDSNPLGNFLIRAREKAKFNTLDAVCEAANKIASIYQAASLELSHPVLSRYESGDWIPSESKLQWICRVYGADEEIGLYLREFQIQLTGKKPNYLPEETKAQALASVPLFAKDKELASLVQKIEKAIQAYSEGKEEDLFVECPTDFMRRLRLASGLTLDEAIDRARQLGSGNLEKFRRNYLSCYEVGDRSLDLLPLVLFGEVYEVGGRVVLYAHFQREYPTLRPQHWIVPRFPSDWAYSQEERTTRDSIRFVRDQKGLTRVEVVDKVRKRGVPWSDRDRREDHLQAIENGVNKLNFPVLSALASPEVLDQDIRASTYRFFEEFYPMLDPKSLKIKISERLQQDLISSRQPARELSLFNNSSLLRRLREVEGFSIQEDIIPLAHEYGFSRHAVNFRQHEINRFNSSRRPSNQLIHLFYSQVCGIDVRVLIKSVEDASVGKTPYYPIRILDYLQERWDFYEQYDPEGRSLGWKILVYRHNPFRSNPAGNFSLRYLGESLGINELTLNLIELCEYTYELTDPIVETLAEALWESPESIREAYRFQRRYLHPLTWEKREEKKKKSKLS